MRQTPHHQTNQTEIHPMTNARPSRRDLQAFSQALTEASQAPRITPQYLAELARKRDQYLARLAA